MNTAELPKAPDPSQEIFSCPFCGTPAVVGQAFCIVCGQPGTPLQEGTRLNGVYRIVSVLSASSTGAVYQAVEERRKRPVVLKELLGPPGSSAGDRSDLAERFSQEVKTIERLKHANLPEIYGGIAVDGRYYLVMALVPGKNLETMLVDRGRGYPERQVREWMSQLTDLLEYLEERRPPFIHGEIMPSHMVVREDGVPCLVGYGLAPRLGLRPYLELPGQSAGRPHTGTAKKSGKSGPLGAIVPKKRGKTGVLSTVDVRDDLYGLGATLHASLTGRDVFAGVDEPERPFPPVREWVPRTSVGIAEIVNHAVAADPALRFPSAVAMRAALAPLVSAPHRLASSGRSDESTRVTTRSWWPISGVVAAIAIVAIVAAVYAFSRSSGTATEPTAVPTSRPGTAVPTLIVPAHTTPVADTFISPTTAWPATRMVYRQGGDLWLDNRAGATTLRATRAGYSTGKDGFIASAVVREVRGPADAAYGLMVIDQPGSPPNYVALLVRGTGAWSLLQTVAGHTAALIPWRQDSAVRRGHNSPNELQLRLVPGKGKGRGRFEITINGRRMAVTAAATSAAPSGRAGVAAAATAQVVCDSLTIATIATIAGPAPVLDEHFLDNSRGWSSADAVFSNNLLRLRAKPGQPWGEASTAKYSTVRSATSLSESVLVSVSSKTAAPGTGGIVFARTAAAAAGKQPLNAALAAAIDTNGKLSVFQLTPGHTKIVFGPLGSKSIRRGYGLNQVRITISRQATSIRAAISVNGSKPILYTAKLAALQPATGIVAIGKDSTVVASAFRIDP